MNWEDDAERLESFREVYCKPTERAVHAAFYMEPGILYDMLRKEQFNTALLNNIKDSGVEGMFPIRYITKCWDIILREDAFAEDCRAFVRWLKLRNNQVKDFYKHWGFDIDKLNIEFCNYDLTYTVFDDYEDDFIKEAIDTYGEAGTREIDVQLYMAGMKCNIPKVKSLLDDGANMTALIYDFEGCHKLTTDLCNEANMMSRNVFYMMQRYWEDPDDGRYDVLDNCELPLNSLMTWAGYETVMKTLMEYSERHRDNE